MYKHLKKLFGEAFFYSLGNIIRRSVSVVTMPIYTRFLTVSEYGILSLVSAFREFLIVILDMGTSTSSTRFYYDCNNKEEKITLFSTLFIFTLGFALVIAVILLIFGEPFWNRIFKDIPFYPYAYIAILTAVMTPPGILVRTLFRVHGKAKQLLKLGILFTFSNVALAVPAVVIFDMNVLGPLLSNLVIMTVFFFIYLRYLWEYLSFRFFLKILKSSLAFGLPDLPVRAGNWVLRELNQILLQHYWSLSFVAIYSVAYSVSGILFELIISAVHWAVQPFYYQMEKEESEEKAKEIFAYVGLLNTTVILFLGLSVISFGEDLLLIFASSKYIDAGPVIIILAISATFQFLFFVPSRVLYLKRKTIYLPPLLFATVGCNVILGFILIPQYGVMGAAWATLIAFFVRAVLTIVISQRVYYVPYDYYRLGKAVLAFFIIILAEHYLPTGPSYFLIPLKLLLLALYPVLLYVFGYFEEREIQKLRKILTYRQ